MTDSTAMFIASAITGAIASLPAIITAWKSLPRIEKKLDEQTKALDGPLALALQTAATATAKLANAEPTTDNVKVAEKAKVLAENHEAGKAAAASPAKS